MPLNPNLYKLVSIKFLRELREKLNRFEELEIHVRKLEVKLDRSDNRNLQCQVILKAIYKQIVWKKNYWGRIKPKMSEYFRTGEDISEDPDLVDTIMKGVEKE